MEVEIDVENNSDQGPEPGAAMGMTWILFFIPFIPFIPVYKFLFFDRNFDFV